MGTWFRKFLKSWGFEAVLALIIIFGLIYITNTSDVNSFAKATIDLVLSAFSTLFKSINTFLTQENGFKYLIAIFGFIGFVLIVFWRLLWRLQGSKRFTGTTCPKCEEPLVRVKSSAWAKKLRPILPLRRFYCRSCGWKGTRVKGNDHIPLNLQPGKPTRIHVDKIS